MHPITAVENGEGRRCYDDKKMRSSSIRSQLHRHSIEIQVDSITATQTTESLQQQECCTDTLVAGEGVVAEGESSPSSSSTRRLREWIVENKDVKEIPEIYPKIINPMTIALDVGLIGDRLLMFLKANKIRSIYDEHHGRVYCLSPKASFVVQFWRRRKTRKENDNNNGVDELTTEEIILEIQRRKGCSYEMQKIRTALKKSILPTNNNSDDNDENSNKKTYCDAMMAQKQHHPRHQNDQLIRMSPTDPPAAAAAAAAAVKPILYESLLKSYRPSRNIKMMYERQRQQHHYHPRHHRARINVVYPPPTRSRTLSADF